LSRNIQNKLKLEPIQLDLWDSMAPALRIVPTGPPKKFNYKAMNFQEKIKRNPFVNN